MTIIAYTNSSESNVMNKQLSEPLGAGSYNCKPYEIVDVETPSFIVRYSAALIACNYIYCAEFGRYYFATVQTKPGEEMIIKCVSDPLMSFKTAIDNCSILVTRAESLGAPTHYTDTQLPVWPSKKNITSIIMEHQAAPLSNDLDASDGDNYLLTVLGGAPHIN